MRTILFIIQKEFIQIFRNRMMVPIIFLLPLVQLIILVNAATLEMKNIDLLIIDNDNSGTSRGLVERFAHSPFFRMKETTFSREEAMKAIERDKADMVLFIPAGFEKQLVRENSSKVQILLNAINSESAGISNAYAGQIIRDYNRLVISDFYPVTTLSPATSVINVRSSFWYNPELNYKVFMVPAVLVILVTLTGALLAALNLVREKEIGTIEQINVTPIRRYQFIIGKLLPFLVIALVELSFGLFLGKLLFNIPMLGSLPLLFLVAVIYLILVQAMGLLISTVSQTQQQAMFIVFFFMLVFIMTSGIFTPVESMPDVAQRFDYANPIFYFMKIIRMILLKGSGLKDIAPELGILSAYAVVMLTFAIRRYRKVA